MFTFSKLQKRNKIAIALVPRDMQHREIHEAHKRFLVEGNIENTDKKIVPKNSMDVAADMAF